jgi:hypothetical protein
MALIGNLLWLIFGGGIPGFLGWIIFDMADVPSAYSGNGKRTRWNASLQVRFVNRPYNWAQAVCPYENGRGVRRSNHNNCQPTVREQGGNISP